ncbi:hypothetical protein [Schauerella aestuarii]|nr:hypothetical protein [Achromobacter aestuarii]
MDTSDWILVGLVAALWVGFAWLTLRLCRAGAMYDELMEWEE